MKLVEILARELGEWPEGYRAIVQSSAPLTLPIEYGRDIIFRGSQWDYQPASMDIYDEEFECSQLATDHTTAIVTREMWQAERDKQGAIQVGIDAANSGCLKPLSEVKARYNGPIQWRDRIREIDADFKIMAAERERLVSELAADGFALIDKPVEDMSDWRNWRVGDLLVKTVGDNLSDEGYISTITNIDGDHVYSTDECGGESWQIGVNTLTDHRWHSRP